MTSCRCGESATFTRRYSGEALCTSCFKSSIVEKTKHTISKYGMLERGQKVGVAVSGGKDSLSLLKIMHELSSAHRYEVAAISVDEGVEGYREEALTHARELSESLGIPHFITSYEEVFGFSLDKALEWKDERELSSCSFCGVFRRRALDEAAVRAGVDVIATAHNLDDYVQTFLMNLFHGDVGRLGWMDPNYSEEGFPLRRVKPFMEIYEEEVAFFAYLSGIKFQSVSCPYMHEGLRSEVRDYLNRMEVGHPGMKNVLFRSSLEVISRFDSGLKKAPVPCRVCGKPSSSGTCSVCRLKAIVDQHVNYSP